MMQANYVPPIGYNGDNSMAPKGNRGKSSSSPFSFNIKMFDLFTKINPMFEDYKVQTTGGGYFTIVGWCIICLLLLSSFSDYMTPKLKDHMIVDTT
jgi:hypothetical protein